MSTHPMTRAGIPASRLLFLAVVLVMAGGAGDAEGQWRHTGERFQPFASVGGGRASDPGFMGVEWGPYASVGSGIALDDTWGFRLELRVRLLGGAMGGPDGMGELTVGVERAVRLLAR